MKMECATMDTTVEPSATVAHASAFRATQLKLVTVDRAGN